MALAEPRGITAITLLSRLHGTTRHRTVPGVAHIHALAAIRGVLSVSSSSSNTQGLVIAVGSPMTSTMLLPSGETHASWVLLRYPATGLVNKLPGHRLQSSMGNTVAVGITHRDHCTGRH